MADFTYSPQAGEPTYESDPEFTLTSTSKSLTTMTNAAGAVVSFALIIGIGVWGYKLLARDVSGIPVVRAAAGEMRVLPDDPGGQLALHQGLSVNVVAAEGSAGRPADELRLAPRPVDITHEDQVVPAAMVATAPQPAHPVTPAPSPEAPDVAAALQSGQVDDLVAQLTAGIAPLSDLPSDSAQSQEVVAQEVVASVSQPVIAEATTPPAEVVAVVLEAPGVRNSLRPRKRPTNSAAVVLASVSTSTAASRSNDVDAASLPVGTRLAQLGAFDSEEVAREQWNQLNTRFSVYLSDKQRIIQKATSGGRVFYRLRAMGFEDIADARRFCSALVAENADCIPVVTR